MSKHSFTNGPSVTPAEALGRFDERHPEVAQTGAVQAADVMHTMEDEARIAGQQAFWKELDADRSVVATVDANVAEPVRVDAALDEFQVRAAEASARLARVTPVVGETAITGKSIFEDVDRAAALVVHRQASELRRVNRLQRPTVARSVRTPRTA